MNVIWILGNQFTLMTSCQMLCGHMIAICSLLCWLPHKVIGETSREVANCCLAAKRTLGTDLSLVSGSWLKEIPADLISAWFLIAQIQAGTKLKILLSPPFHRGEKKNSKLHACLDLRSENSIMHRIPNSSLPASVMFCSEVGKRRTPGSPPAWISKHSQSPKSFSPHSSGTLHRYRERRTSNPSIQSPNPSLSLTPCASFALLLSKGCLLRVNLRSWLRGLSS